MSYTTLSDLLAEFSSNDLAKLTGDPTGSAVNESRIQHFAEKSAAVIDAFLCGIYALPFANGTPPIIRSISTDLCVFFLFESAMAKTGLPESVILRMESATKSLRQIQNGSVRLPGVASLESIYSNTGAAIPIFTSTRLDAFYGNE